MAAGDVVYGTRTVLANISRLHSVATTEARTFGEIDNSTAVALDYHIRLAIPISSSATAGTYEVYIVTSQDGAEWTDNIDPTADTGNVAAKIADARLVDVVGTVYDATNRLEAEFHFNIMEILTGLAPPKFIGFVWVNKSGQTSPASGADGDSQSLKIAAS